MLQIDHVYEFFYRHILKDITVYTLPNGVYRLDDISFDDVYVFNFDNNNQKILFLDQEPIINKLSIPYINVFEYCNPNTHTLETMIELRKTNSLKYNMFNRPPGDLQSPATQKRLRDSIKTPVAMVISEYSTLSKELAKTYNIEILYYFFHGFAASDWFRSFQVLNYNKQIIKKYQYDFVSFNRIISDDRSYRCLFISKLVEHNLLDKGRLSFGLDTTKTWEQEITSADTKLSTSAIQHIQTYLPEIKQSLIIDKEHVNGYDSSDIPRIIDDCFWHVVTETVFYYDKLHLTEKIFKPIVMKQPFMLIGAVGNLEYLRSYGFKTFDGIIDESYDNIIDPDQRIDAVVTQLKWYCGLSDNEKLDIMKAVEPIVEYNFNHFYNDFRSIITNELLNNCQELFKKIGYDDSTIAYNDIYKTLVN